MRFIWNIFSRISMHCCCVGLGLMLLCCITAYITISFNYIYIVCTALALTVPLGLLCGIVAFYYAPVSMRAKLPILIISNLAGRWFSLLFILTFCYCLVVFAITIFSSGSRDAFTERQRLMPSVGMVIAAGAAMNCAAGAAATRVMRR